jgi:hypothetical protein
MFKSILGMSMLFPSISVWKPSKRKVGCHQKSK